MHERIRRARFWALAAGLALVAACAPAEGPAEPPDDEPGTEPTDPPAEDADMEVTGTFSGDPELEGGCAWVEADDGTRYEILWPAGYEIAWDPLELRGPDGEIVARDGEPLTVTGSTAEGAVSICMVGPIVEAESVATG